MEVMVKDAPPQVLMQNEGKGGGARGAGGAGGARKGGEENAQARGRQRRMSISGDSLRQLKLDPKKIEIIQSNVGRGTFGDVHKAMWNGVTVAIKQLATIDENSMRMFRYEVLLMNQVSE